MTRFPINSASDLKFIELHTLVITFWNSLPIDQYMKRSIVNGYSSISLDISFICSWFMYSFNKYFLKFAMDHVLD